MGLDMYAYRVKPDPANTPFSFKVAHSDLAYWRKFNALHGWMETRYWAKGGDSSQAFNCTPLQLTAEDLDKLEQDIDRLVPVEGFFFGPQEYSADDKADVRKFITEARAVLNDGDLVYYDSWW